MLVVMVNNCYMKFKGSVTIESYFPEIKPHNSVKLLDKLHKSKHITDQSANPMHLTKFL